MKENVGNGKKGRVKRTKNERKEKQIKKRRKNERKIKKDISVILIQAFVQFGRYGTNIILTAQSTVPVALTLECAAVCPQCMCVCYVYSVCVFHIFLQ
jgi:hypothetical protein